MARGIPGALVRAFRILLVLPLAFLPGCVTDQSGQSLAVASPVARGQATVAITRPGGWYSSAVAVDIEANGTRIASIDNGGSYTGPVAPGPVTLTATSWSSPGRYSVHFNAEPGKRYAFAVTPRDEQAAVMFIGGVVGLAADTIANGETSGAFKIIAAPQ